MYRRCTAGGGAAALSCDLCQVALQYQGRSSQAVGTGKTFSDSSSKWAVLVVTTCIVSLIHTSSSLPACCGYTWEGRGVWSLPVGWRVVQHLLPCVGPRALCLERVPKAPAVWESQGKTPPLCADSILVPVSEYDLVSLPHPASVQDLVALQTLYQYGVVSQTQTNPHTSLTDWKYRIWADPVLTEGRPDLVLTQGLGGRPGPVRMQGISVVV